MNTKKLARWLAALLIISFTIPALHNLINASPLAADNPAPPVSPVKLIFVHHSTGGNWLADPNEAQPYGGLALALRDNNYYVSATNYEWGPDGIGSNTDTGHWWEWFRGDNSSAYLTALYTESGQNIYTSDDWRYFGNWSRLAADPGGENEIIMFKSCFPNAHLGGSPSDPVPAIGSNPLRGEGAYNSYPDEPNPHHTIANAKGIYIDILEYFRTRQDKLFIVITAPPQAMPHTDATHAANARAFNDWLVNDWLDGYPYHNVAVFDFYNVLTSNGSASRVDDPATNEEPHDAGLGDGNHHRWNGSAVEHIQTIPNNYAAYPSDSAPEYPDSHPTTFGHQKATAEFVQLLNVFYNRWRSGAAATPTAATPTTTATVGTPVPTVTGAPGWIYLPLILKGFPYIVPTATPTTPPTPTATPTTSGVTTLVQPADLVYQGAFRLPDDAEKPRTFEYGGNALTFNPTGDPAGAADGYPGSLFITGHDRQVDELPDGDQVAEISIPVPVASRNLDDLNYAGFLQGFSNIAAGQFVGLDEIPRVGMEYLNVAATGPKIHLAWGQHMPPEIPPATHAWFDPNLAAPNFQGTWYIGEQSFDSVTGYILEIPAAWADTYASGRYLATGRYRDGGWSGMGPTIFAYRPWQTDGSPPPAGTRLEETVLLRYASSRETDNIEQCLTNYQHADEWEGGAWLTTGAGKTAVLFAGTKATGAKYWYGWVNPAGAEYPCVEVELIDQFILCRLADGSSCPPEDFAGCAGHNDYRGWWSARFDAQFILYDPASLAQVAAGALNSWDPQPYATVDIDDYLYFNPPEGDLDDVGRGDQRRMRIGAVAYDRNNALLYVIERFGDEAKPIVHVWRVQ